MGYENHRLPPLRVVLEQQFQQPRPCCSSPGCQWARRLTGAPGLVTNARAMATRCCSPPDSSMGRWLARFSIPTNSKASMAETRAAFRRWPAYSDGSATFSAAVSVGTRLNAWNTNPICSARILVRSRSGNSVASLRRTPGSAAGRSRYLESEEDRECASRCSCPIPTVRRCPPFHRLPKSHPLLARHAPHCADLGGRSYGDCGLLERPCLVLTHTGAPPRDPKPEAFHAGNAPPRFPTPSRRPLPIWPSQESAETVPSRCFTDLVGSVYEHGS